jgi:alpha-galactosidase
MADRRYPRLALKLTLFGLVCWNCARSQDSRWHLLDSANAKTMKADGFNEVIVSHVEHEIRLNAQRPAKEWASATPVRFSADWQGKNPDAGLETQVRVLWSPETLYLRFVCRYRGIFVFDESEANGRRDHLWDRDVAEAFLQPPDAHSTSSSGSVAQGRLGGTQAYVGSESSQIPLKYYKEFEVAPNGMWIDLDITPVGRADLRSRLSRSVYLDEKRKIWAAELAIPMKSLTAKFDPRESWRVNFYRVEGNAEPRKYMAWRPTMTEQSNFHVPERFGTMRFAQ